MQKIVSMEIINKVFDDVTQVDYITVSNVTDSMLYLDVHLKSVRVPKSKDDLMFYNDRSIVLGKILDRKVSLNLIPVKWYVFLANKLSKNFFKNN